MKNTSYFNREIDNLGKSLVTRKEKLNTTKKG